VPIDRKRKSSTPPATPRHCSPSAARLTSFSSHAQPEPRLEGVRERRALEPRDVRREGDRAPLRVDDAGNADDDAVQEPVVQAGRLDERRPELGDLGEDARGVGMLDLDIEAGPDVAAEVADRTAEEATADVEPERERRLGDGLEEDRPVPRAARPLGGLADEPRVEERPERERHGRLRDPGPARDLRARDRGARADRLEHRPHVEVLEERRKGRGGDVGLRIHGCSRTGS